MSGDSVALDTGVAKAILAGEADSLVSSSDVRQFFLPVPVVGELRYGALNPRGGRENLAALEQLVERCRALPVTLKTAEIDARIRLALREQGEPTPENDVWIAAICVEHQVPPASRDGHFDYVRSLARHPV